MISCRVAASHEHGLDFRAVQLGILKELSAADDKKMLLVSPYQENLARAPSLISKPMVCLFPLPAGMKHKDKPIRTTQTL